MNFQRLLGIFLRVKIVNTLFDGKNVQKLLNDYGQNY